MDNQGKILPHSIMIPHSWRIFLWNHQRQQPWTLVRKSLAPYQRISPTRHSLCQAMDSSLCVASRKHLEEFHCSQPLAPWYEEYHLQDNNRSRTFRLCNSRFYPQQLLLGNIRRTGVPVCRIWAIGCSEALSRSEELVAVELLWVLKACLFSVSQELLHQRFLQWFLWILNERKLPWTVPFLQARSWLLW
jgi:hypothetical protein